MTTARSKEKKIRVLVVDDSAVARDMLAHMLASDPEIEIAGTAANGHEAVESVTRLHPDLVTMDIHMPTMDGLQATEQIMAYTPTPILVVSSSVYAEGMGSAFEALSLGALEVVRKPELADRAGFESARRELVRSAKILSHVKVVTHLRGRRGPSRRRQGRASGADAAAPACRGPVSLVAIGSSTGGPAALLSILGGLPTDFPAPVLVTQHIADGFVPGLVSWLNDGCAIDVMAAADGTGIRPGAAYFAATGSNMEVDGDVLFFTPPGPGQLYIPSADTLFASVARTRGADAAGVLLTGMGVDGASGLAAMRAAGAVTIAQDEATSRVFGMPKAAIDAGAADTVLAVDEIAAELVRLASAP